MTGTPLPVGTRVRHYGHQYARAHAKGTATVAGHVHVNGWLEYVVDVDEDVRGVPWDGDHRRRQWAATATIPIGRLSPDLSR